MIPAGYPNERTFMSILGELNISVSARLEISERLFLVYATRRLHLLSIEFF